MRRYCKMHGICYNKNILILIDISEYVNPDPDPQNSKLSEKQQAVRSTGTVFSPLANKEAVGYINTYGTVPYLVQLSI